MNAQRPRSQTSGSNGMGIKLQTTYKPRMRGQSGNEKHNESQKSDLYRPNLMNSRHNHEEYTSKEDQFNKTANKISKITYRHHHPELCVCEDCICGRHLCKLHATRPGLNNNTIYKQDFNKKKPILNIVPRASETNPLKGPHLEMNSTYLNDFPGKKGDSLDKRRPEDLLHSSGPSPQLTTYSAGFPGYKGPNQYIKPTNKHARDPFPLRSQSTYGRNFPYKTPMKDDYTYFPDNLKTGSNWFGNTTYDNFYKNPNPEDYANKVKIVQKLEKNPDYGRQYETTYGNDFLKKKSTVCPAKISLQTKLQGFMTNTKSNFTENSDFKALSPDFHAISTSKHSYV